MEGGVWLGANERGALGFSNEKSLMYWPSTLSCGGFCCACGSSPPLVAMVMNPTSARPPDLSSGGVANIGPRHEQGYLARNLGNDPWSDSPAILAKWRIG